MNSIPLIGTPPRDPRRSVRRPALAVLGVAALATALVASASPAAAGGYHSPGSPGTPVTLTDGLISPLSLDVGARGTAYLSQNFTGQVTAVDRAGVATTIAAVDGYESSAVTSRHGTVYFAKVANDHSSAVMMALRPGGEPQQFADIQAYEARVNPDRVNRYGFVGLPQVCLDQIPADAPIPAVYTGIVDTHPYASLATRTGLYLADAGANAILRVGYNGKVSKVAVLPPGDPVAVTADLAEQAGFPDCVVGYKYRFEPVPTDVEFGPDGWLYVTSLPGGTEDASLGARGAVYKVNPYTGAVRKVAGGFVTATGLAVSKSGTVYVAELFGGAEGTGQVSVVKRGAARAFLALSQPAAIELSGNRLYVTTDALAEGPTAKVTVVPLRSHHHRH